MEPEKSQLKRQVQALNTAYLWWLAGGFISGIPFFSSLVSVILFTPLAFLFVILALIPPIYVIIFQKYFFDSNAERIKNRTLIFPNRPVAYIFMLISMLAGSIAGWVVFSGIIGSSYSF